MRRPAECVLSPLTTAGIWPVLINHRREARATVRLVGVFTPSGAEWLIILALMFGTAAAVFAILWLIVRSAVRSGTRVAQVEAQRPPGS